MKTRGATVKATVNYTYCSETESDNLSQPKMSNAQLGARGDCGGGSLLDQMKQVEPVQGRSDSGTHDDGVTDINDAQYPGI